MTIGLQSIDTERAEQLPSEIASAYQAVHDSEDSERRHRALLQLAETTLMDLYAIAGAEYDGQRDAEHVDERVETTLLACANGAWTLGVFQTLVPQLLQAVGHEGVLGKLDPNRVSRPKARAFIQAWDAVTQSWREYPRDRIPEEHPYDSLLAGALQSVEDSRGTKLGHLFGKLCECRNASSHRRNYNQKRLELSPAYYEALNPYLKGALFELLDELRVTLEGLRDFRVLRWTADEAGRRCMELARCHGTGPLVTAPDPFTDSAEDQRFLIDAEGQLVLRLLSSTRRLAPLARSNNLEANLGLRVEHDKRVNYALQQNAVPVVHRFQVTNNGDKRLDDLTVSLQVDAELSEPWRESISKLEPGETFSFETIDLRLNGDTLRLQNERQSAVLIAKAVARGVELASLRLPIEVLAFNEWGGLESIPESLAAFVLPNQPEIASILANASQLLAQATGDSSLAGYQRGDPSYVRHVVQAIYTAIQALDLSYANPPASFEASGQKVRIPNEIVRHKLGTCLDLTLLMAACFEQAGLHPIMVLVQGHAFVGVWTVDDYLPDATTDDPVRIRKRLELGEILCLEATGVTSGASRMSFEDAVRVTTGRFGPTPEFLCAIDVRAARAAYMRPLPIRSDGSQEEPVALPPLTPARFSPSGRLLSAPGAEAPQRGPAAEASASTTSARLRRIAPRVEKWKRKLLDLSLRNKLISYKAGRSAIPLQCPDVAKLEDALASGHAFQVLAEPELMGWDDPRSRELQKQRTGSDPIEDHLRTQLGRQIVHSTLGESDLDKRLLKAFREARLTLEESGATTLFLAVGFLKWFETPRSPKERLAPLLLFPISLERPSAREGFRLRLSDDDPLPNYTLLEKLKLDFPMVDVRGLDELPTDDSGIDVPKVLRSYREAVCNVDRWEVLEDAHIGTFSFTKFLMWRDLEQHQDLVLGSKVVGHLVERPDQPFEPGADFPVLDRLDDERAPATTYCPRDADSSQLAAVFAGTDGHTFVLQGPPGTGKSQTITNLISNMLAHGKRVLFVSEKMAALNVVHKRLSDVGLAPFCLELHSRKANKTQVYGQLEESYQASSTHSPEEWEATARQLAQLRKELNAYTKALHLPREFGSSVFQVQSRLTALRRVPRLLFPPGHWQGVDRERLLDLHDLSDRLQEAAKGIGSAPTHPFHGARCQQLPAGSQARVVALSGSLLELIEDAQARLKKALELCGLSELATTLPSASRSTLQSARKALELVTTTPGPELRLLTEPGWVDLKPRLENLVDRGRDAVAARSGLEQDLGPELFELDLSSTLATLQYGLTAFFLWAWFFRWRARGVVQRACPGRSVPVDHELLGVLTQAQELLREERALKEEQVGTALLGPTWLDRARDWDRLQHRVRWAGEFRGALRELDPPPATRDGLVALATTDRDRLAPGSPLQTSISAALRAVQELEETLEQIRKLLQLDLEQVLPPQAPYLQTLATRARGWRDQASKLRDWAHWRRVRAKCGKVGLKRFAVAFETEKLRADHISACFKRSFYEAWLNATVDRTPALSTFHSPEHDRKIVRFRELDAKHLELTKRCAQAMCAKRVPPRSGSRADSSESGVLSRQLGLKRRQLPLRQLFKRIPNLLFRLKPCMLMSPLSVAQYLDPKDFPNFDVVVFDEASQIPPWDAIGALARADSAIVVGDSKQMPPTNFFGRSDDGEDSLDEDDVQELESILEECMASGLPTLHLNWHYRSRHESLITFSNFHYYDNRLNTFPAAATDVPGLGVEFRHCKNGVYDKGKSRTNEVEARAIVAELSARLLADVDSPERADSIGVVTFSQAQQGLVEDLLDQARRDDPRLEPFFDESVPEQVFVKNLENVQGDERDVILFSICYGPDATGRVGVSFGPLNRDGGERRLNVAITRARKQVVVFSSIRADQIDLSRTRSLAVKHLKTFLDFADRGVRAMAEATAAASDDAFESPLEEEVCSALRAKGWEVDTQVGCSGYRIDLGVRDPKAPGRYLLGIECDGANYHSAQTARDRDRLRQDVLETLGWRLQRVWSTDWWRDPKSQIAILHQALLDAEEERAKPRPPQPTPFPASRSAGTENRALFASQPSVSAAASQTEPVEPLTSTEESHPLPGQESYVALNPSGLRPLRVDFYTPEALPQLREWITRVLACEGPLSVKTLTERILGASNLTRAGKRVRQQIDVALASLPPLARPQQTGDCLWGPGQDPRAYRTFRVPGPNSDPRKLTEIPPQEFANAAAALLERMVSVSSDDLAREVARVFGIKRMGKKVRASAQLGLDLLVAQGRAEKDGDLLIQPRT